MSQQNSLAKISDVKDVSSMLLPIATETPLLVPGTTVAEIVSFITPAQDDEDAPNWYLGNIQWRNLSVPLLSFETLLYQQAPALSQRCRIAVLNNSGLNHQLDFYAIVIQGTPRLLRVVPETVSVAEDKEVQTGEKMHVNAEGEQALIPDLSYLEQSLIDFMELT